MQNTRPTYSFDLPLKDGTIAHCTLKTPKMRLKTAVSELTIKQTLILEESNGIYKKSNAISDRIGAAIVAKDAEAEKIARAELEEIVTEIEIRRDAQDQTLIDRMALVTNIPNAEDGTPRSIADVDFDECDTRDLADALNFFVNGQTK